MKRGIVFALALAGCGGSSTGGSMQPVAIGTPQSQQIQHVVIMIQENRTFDNLFATFPGADGTTTGKLHTGKSIGLAKRALLDLLPLQNNHLLVVTAYDGGKMDGFDLTINRYKPLSSVYQYVNPAQIRPYWTMAKQYVLGDRMFQTQGSGSFVAHQDLIAGGSAINRFQSIVDQPSHGPWGCDAPSGTLTSLLTVNHRYLKWQGPFPCLEYPTLRDLLDAKKVSWKYYTPIFGKTWESSFWNGFDAIKAVRYSPEWTKNVTSPETKIFSDITRGALPAVSWVIPSGPNSDHPGVSPDGGPSWVAQVVNAIGQSQYWSSTAIVVVWDDWGGFYDHVPPQQLDYQGLGFRVPLIVVSAYAKKGYVSHTQYEFGSILKFVEDNWSLGRLGATDVRANSMADVFDFSASPRPFQPIPATYSKSYFEHQRLSNTPVDDE